MARRKKPSKPRGCCRKKKRRTNCFLKPPPHNGGGEFHPRKLLQSRIQAGWVFMQNAALIGRAELGPVRGELYRVRKAAVEMRVIRSVQNVIASHHFGDIRKRRLVRVAGDEKILRANHLRRLPMQK